MDYYIVQVCNVKYSTIAHEWPLGWNIEIIGTLGTNLGVRGLGIYKTPYPYCTLVVL